MRNNPSINDVKDMMDFLVNNSKEAYPDKFYYVTGSKETRDIIIEKRVFSDKVEIIIAPRFYE